MSDPLYKLDPTAPRNERRFPDVGIAPKGGWPKSRFDPANYYNLTPAQKAALEGWIRYAVRPFPALTADRAVPAMAMLAQFAAVAFAVSPGAFYGAMAVEGYHPTLASVRSDHWRYQVAPRSSMGGYYLDHLSSAERAAFDSLVAAAS